MGRLRDILMHGAQELNVELDDAALGRFEQYFELLEEKNKVMNLTAISGEEDVARLHFLDCIALHAAVKLDGLRVIDVGSGAGFPGLPLKIARPGMELTLLDSLGKRVTFLQEVTEQLGLEAVCVAARAEEQVAKPGWRESFDAATSRAVAGLSMLCELTLPYVKPGGMFIAMKGVDSDEEIKAARRALRELGGEVERVFDYPVPGTDITHRAVIIRKTRPTPAKYPRRFAKIKSSPL